MYRHPLTIAVLAAISVAGAAHPVLAQETRTTPAGVAWMTGGAGQDEREAMQAQAREYNLAMTFANRTSGAFRADVSVQVYDARGEVVLAARDAGPLLFARLAPGTYRVSAKALGRTQSQQVAVPHEGTRELYFYWVDPSDPGSGGRQAAGQPYRPGHGPLPET